MNSDSIKRQLADTYFQVVVLDEEGRLVECDHHLLDLSEWMGEPVLEQFEMFVGLTEAILAMSPGDPPLTMPIVEFSWEGEKHLFNHEFRRIESGLVWILHRQPEAMERLRSMQQERNDTSILLERIRQQELELRRLNEKLRYVNQELDRFAYVVSHDLKSPLRSIRNLAQWLAEDLAAGDSGEVENYSRLLNERTRQMESLIEGVLQYSRAGRENVPAREVDLGSMVRDICDQTAGAERVRFHLGENLPVLHTHATHLFQVFSNLISNAVKYGHPEHPEVWVSAVQTAEGWQFEVRDNGQGIAPDDQKRIFEMFETLSESNYENTGIGLAIVEKLVRENGGQISVDSTPGKGAAFRFTWLA